jgi:hypothetical protein
MGGVVVTTLLIELRHDDAPNTCRPVRGRLPALCGTTLSYTGGMLLSTDCKSTSNLPLLVISRLMLAGGLLGH